ncbi:helix-turn-helix domain-containing protein [Actinokineospora soli]|uniref:Helix-turn-helix domain-containing protein n=1 Tax=Actinokineospora soli TaxID=1048753 RepID=A0ABW2TTI1_9PSEU
MAIQTGIEATETEFGRLLRRHRERVGLTQRELADLSTISVRAIRDLEQGRARKPRPDTVRLIADGLRLGGQARADLAAAVDHGRLPRGDYDAALAPAPVAAEALVGREAEVAALVHELLERARPVRIVGLPGVGKSRLAQAVAARLHERRMPVLWATAPGHAPAYDGALRDDRLAALVTDAAAELCAGHGPAPATADLVDVIGDRPTVLVLDGAGDAERVRRLTRDCPGLRVIVTATEPGDDAERTFVLAPLDAAASAELFRASAGLPLADEPVAEVCGLLDGLPGALAAAASWLAVFDVDTLVATVRHDPGALLDDLAGRAPGRERLAAALAALPAPTRDLLRRLDGDFTLADLAAATGAALPEAGRALRSMLVRGVVGQRAPGCFRVLGVVAALL